MNRDDRQAPASSAVTNPHRLFVLAPEAKEERLFAMGEGSARLSEGRPDGGVASPRRLWASPYYADSIVAFQRTTREPLERRGRSSRPRSLAWPSEHRRLYGVSLCGVFATEEER
jgi:hypothetical protein